MSFISGDFNALRFGDPFFLVIEKGDHLFGVIVAALICIAIGYVVSAGICLALLRYWPSSSKGWDHGDLERKSQKRPVMRLGGVGIAVSLIVFIVFSSFSFESMASQIEKPWYLLLVCLLFFAIGLLDDLKPTHALVKLAAQIAVASFAYAVGFRIGLISEPFSGTSVQMDGFSFPITILWIITVPNLINLIDGMDGIAGGVGISLLSTLAVVSWMGGDALAALLCVGVVGAVAGFLTFNLPRARIYLGDGGAYLIGSFIAVTSISVSQKGAVGGALLVVVIALSLPIADAVFAVLRRFFYGFPIWKADSEHIHHRLVTLGVRRCFVIGGMVAGVFVFSVLGMLLLIDHGRVWPIVLTVSVVSVCFLIHVLGYWGGFKDFRKHVKRVCVTRERVRYACVLGTVLEHEIDRAPSHADFWSDFDRSLAKVGLFPVSEMGKIAHPDMEIADMEVIEIPMANGDVWNLAHRPETVAEMHWGKVAVCFLGPLCRAMNKWGEVPLRMGIKGDSTSADLAETGLERGNVMR